MKNFEIISDGACDLADETVSKLGIRVVPFYVAYDEQNYLREKVDFTVQDFYQKLIDNPGIFPKTSMPTAEDYMKEFERAYDLD
ncbi:MAG: DegV family protein, partial [Anaeroplasmataceae bacterium]|nr:DegV family protein [Anaeroplasmataceae bacterium]